MNARLTTVSVKNFRALADVSLSVKAVNVLFGPNGDGKSSFLDTIWFVRDCANRSVETASSFRSHGIGLLYDGADEGSTVSVSLGTDEVEYQLTFGLSSGRIEPFAGERLYSHLANDVLVERSVGSNTASFRHAKVGAAQVPLREPQKLSLGLYLDFGAPYEADQMDRVLRFVHSHHCRSFYFHALKNKGSESSHETWLWERGENLWSVLRNLRDRQALDDRYDTIMSFMRRAFPTFDGLVFEQIGPNNVYASFLEKRRRKPIRASGVSDGHLQALLLFTSLFAEGADRESIVILDEPEVSLHPWAIAVFAEAVKLAASQRKKQCFIATHSPVLVSQFDPDQILSVDAVDGRTAISRLSDRQDLNDLLETYSVGSLYMAQVVGSQADSPAEASNEEPVVAP
jgi:predicted ATPase